MKDNLQDIIQYTHGLGVIDLIKVTGTKKDTSILAIAEDRSVVVSGTLNTPISDFEGVFGMPNLSKLKTILGFEEYDDSAKISVTKVDRDGDKVPAAIHFETKGGDFLNDYRLMSKNLIEDKVKNVTFKGANWDVEFEPSVVAIQRLKRQSQANSEEENFTTKTDGGNLKIFFGNAATHSGNFVFEPNVKGKLTKAWLWPVKVFISIMDLPGNKTVRISDQGATEITVDSGMASYRYLLPAQSK